MISQCDNAGKEQTDWYLVGAQLGYFSSALIQILGWVRGSPPYLQAPVEAMAAFSTMARVSAQKLEKGGEEQDEKMLQGSELEDPGGKSV